MVEVKIPFISGENRELAELGRDTLSGSDWFWVQFFLIGFGAGAFPLALDYYFGYRPLGIQGMYWFAGAWFLAGMWAGANKFWDDQKRGSPRWSSPGFEGTVRTNRGTVYIPAVTEKSVMVYPSLRAVPEGVDNLVHWTPSWRSSACTTGSSSSSTPSAGAPSASLTCRRGGAEETDMDA